MLGNAVPELPIHHRLPDEPDVLAPDGSWVRLLVATAQASMAHFELAAGETSSAQCHRTVTELWYVLGGRGRMWRGDPDDPQQGGVEIELVAGVALTIPVGTAFQFAAAGGPGDPPLIVVGTTTPPWPGEGEAYPVTGPWTATVGT